MSDVLLVSAPEERHNYHGKNSLGTIYWAINNAIARSSGTFGTCFIQRPLGTRQRIEEARESSKSSRWKFFDVFRHITIYHHKFSSFAFMFIARMKIFITKYFARIIHRVRDY